MTSAFENPDEQDRRNTLAENVEHDVELEISIPNVGMTDQESSMVDQESEEGQLLEEESPEITERESDVELMAEPIRESVVGEWEQQLKHGFLTSVSDYLQEMKQIRSDDTQISNEDLSLLHSMFTIPTGDDDMEGRSLTITYEKSQDHVFSLTQRRNEGNKFRGSISENVKPNQNIEPFALQCLHLFDGNWTVLKPLNSSAVVESQHLEKEKEEKDQSSAVVVESSESSDSFVDPRRFLALDNPDYHIKSQSRTFRHPLSFIRESQQNIFASVHALKIGAGNLEPLFSSLELFNGRTGQQLSERFYFHLNSYSIINDFLDDFNYKKQLLKYHKDQPTPHAIFSLSNYSSSQSPETADENLLGGALSNALLQAMAMQADMNDENNPRDVYILLRVEKTLQGQTMDSIFKQYGATTSHENVDQARSAIEAQCTGMKNYLQPFLFAFAPLFEFESGTAHDANIPVCIDHGHGSQENRNGSGNSLSSRRQSFRTTDPIERSRRDSLRMGRRASTTLKHLSTLFANSGSDHKAARHLGSVKLRSGLVVMNHMYSMNVQENLIEMIQREGMRDGTLKRQKSVEGHCLLEISEFDPLVFESNALLRKKLVGQRKSTNQSFTLDQAIASVLRHNDAITQDPSRSTNKSQSLPSDVSESGTNAPDNQQRKSIPDVERKQYLKYQCREFSHQVPKSPFFTFTHQLYVYPEAVNFSKTRPHDQNKLKPRNILCEVVFKDTATEKSSRIVQRYTHELVDTQNCGVTFMSKAPQFFDEICVMLPLPILPTHHLLFNFYHLHIDKNVSKRRKDLDEDQKVIKTLLGHCVLPISHTIEPQQNTLYLPIYQNLSKNYLREQDEMVTYDTKKNIFRCRTSLESTIFPKERSLSQFFKDCSPFLNVIDPKQRENANIVSKATDTAISALTELQDTSSDPAKIVSHFPLVVDMVFSIMCRSPDILNSFVNSTELESQNRDDNSAHRDNRNSIISGSFGSRHRGSQMFVSGSSPPHESPPDSPVKNSGSFFRSSIRHRSIATVALNEGSSSPPSEQRGSFLSKQHGSSSRIGSRRRSAFHGTDKRKSKDEQTATAMENVAQPGDANFNLFQFLQAQQQQQQQQEQQQQQQSSSSASTSSTSGTTASPSSPLSGGDATRSKRRKSLFQTMSNKIKGGRRSNTDETLDLVSLSAMQQTGSLSPHASATGGNEITDFFGISSKLFDLQKEAFKTLVHLINRATTIHMDPSRSNPLLSSYVGFIFKDVVLTTSPLCFVLAEQWSEILIKGSTAEIRDEGPRRRKSGGSLKDRRRTRGNASEGMEWSSVDQNGQATDLLSMTPLYYQSLSCAWFFFDVMIKSFMLSKPDPADDTDEFDPRDSVYSRGSIAGNSEGQSLRFCSILRELLSAIVDKLLELKEDSANASLAQSLNQHVATFFRDLLSTHMDTKDIFQLVERYLSLLCKSNMNGATVKLLVDFIYTFSDDPLFLAMNNEKYMPQDVMDTNGGKPIWQNYFAPPAHMLTKVVRLTRKYYKQEPELLSMGASCVNYILTRCDLDERYQKSAEQRHFLARVYLPFAEMIVKTMDSELYSFDAAHVNDHCKCVMWILVNLDEQFLCQNVLKDQEMNVGLMKFIALSTGLITSPVDLTKDHETVDREFDKAFGVGLQHLFCLICKTDVTKRLLREEMERCKNEILEPMSTDISNAKPFSGSFARAMLETDSDESTSTDNRESFLQLCVYTLVQLIVQSHGSEMQESFYGVVCFFIDDILQDTFNTYMQSTYFKWIYAAIIHGIELPSRKSDVANDRMSQLLAKMEHCITSNESVMSYENSCRVEEIGPIYIDEKGRDVEFEENTGHVKASTLDRLVAQVTAQQQGDSNLQEIFFLTYRSFCTPVQLLHKLIGRFVLANRQNQDRKEDSMLETLDLAPKDGEENDNVEPSCNVDDKEDESIATEVVILDEESGDGENDGGQNDEGEQVDDEQQAPQQDERQAPQQDEQQAPQQDEQQKEVQLTLSKTSAPTNVKILVLRVINALRFWLNEHFYDFESNSLVVSLFRFLGQQLSHSEHVPSKVVNLLKRRLEQNLFGMDATLSTAAEMELEKPILPRKSVNMFDIDLLDWHEVEVARQLTLIEWDMFKRVLPKELLMLGWTKKNKKSNSPNIVALTNRFNQLSEWVSTQIVQKEDLKQRAQLVKHFIHIAHACVYQLNNLNGANSIISALNNAGVHRLKRTWDTVEKISKKDNTMTIFRSLCDLFSMDSSFKGIRSFMATNTIGHACIPYIGVYLTDLVFIEDGNKDTRTVHGKDLINFVKRRQIAKVIMDIRRFQQSGVYNVEPVPMLRDFLIRAVSQSLSDSQVYKCSLQIEPRTTAATIS